MLEEPLAYGMYIKRRGVCIWCMACGVVVGRAKTNYMKAPVQMEQDTDACQPALQRRDEEGLPAGGRPITEMNFGALVERRMV